MSQERLALESGIDPAYVGRVERGRENVTLNTLEVLAGTLGVSIADLFRVPLPSEEAPKPLRAGRKKK
ncbi:helix-turn-helix domain-containing protein [Rhizobium sp. TH2]|uniref:helix-turn-helix domain-containing protein n=1 Tax=Rhizobium sp. TH2 TaxID=2775403 RepID=UPI0035BEA468